jgi:hypothetical protein
MWMLRANETPDPRRSDAVKPRIQCVRQGAAGVTDVRFRRPLRPMTAA